jgi:hypothetical protein
VDEDPDRAPLAFNPNPVTSVQHASLDKRATSDVQTSEPVEDLADDEADYIPWWQKRTYKAESAEEPTTTPAVDRPSLIAQ